MTWRHLLLMAGLLVSAGLALFGDSDPVAVADIATERVNATSRVSGKQPKKSADDSQPVQSLLPRSPLQPLPKDWPERPPRLFAAHSWASTAAPKAVVDAGPPTAPPLPFAYLGMKREDALLYVFLASGDRTYVVRQGDVLGELYRIESIEPPTMKVMYLPLQQVQTLQIGVIE